MINHLGLAPFWFPDLHADNSMSKDALNLVDAMPHGTVWLVNSFQVFVPILLQSWNTNYGMESLGTRLWATYLANLALQQVQDWFVPQA